MLDELKKDREKNPELVDSISSRLEGACVVVSLDAESAADRMTQQTAIALVVQLGRFVPRVIIDCPPAKLIATGPFTPGRATITEAIFAAFTSANEHARAAIGTATPADMRIHVGRNKPDADIYVDVDGWNIFITSRPLGDVRPRAWNPATPLAGASAAAARAVWKIVEPERSMVDLRLSLLTYGDPDTAPNPEVKEAIDIGEVVLLGVGSIATSFVWCLASASPSGHLTLVDHDKGERRNIARYILLSTENYNLTKVEAAASILRVCSPGLDLAPRVETIGDYARSLSSDKRLPLVIISPDNLDARREAADILPKTAIVATTRQGLATAMHCHFATTMCAYCTYAPRGEAPHQWEIWANLTGLHADRVEKLSIPPVDSSPNLLPLAPSDVATIEKNLNFRPGSLRTWVGKTLPHFLAHERARLYSARSVSSGDIDSTNVNLVLAPVSALAGALTMAELLKELAPGLHEFASNYGRVDLDVTVGAQAIALPPQRAETKCLCQHPARLRAYARIYPEDAEALLTWSSRWRELGVETVTPVEAGGG